METNRKKLTFESNGQTLSGLLELPSGDPLAFVLFAHCFTCGKDIVAASRISRSLASLGYAVLRFDFTGLGSSDGDFANTNFSSNVQDLAAAADFLRQNYRAPSLLIGHSLGGAAVLKVAEQVPEAVGIVTIGAPAEASHVAKLLTCEIETIEREGEAEVSLAGRLFKIKKQFLDDLSQQNIEHVGKLRKALLILHAPFDATVPISEAEKIFRAAKHPKSFVSLDSADHLLTKSVDAKYVAETIAAWASRFLPDNETVQTASSTIGKGKITVEERNHVFTQNVVSDSHYWLADEPLEVGGDNLGPDPYEHLLAALGTCTSMTIRMYANRKKLPLDHVAVHVSHSRQHGDDCEHCDEENRQVDVIKRKIELKGDLTTEQRNKLMQIADKCPVHKTLHGKIVVS